MSETSEHQATPDQQDRVAVANEIFRTGATFDAFTSQMRRAYGINAHERLALSALWSRGPMTMTELGAWIPLSRAAVTTLVDRLEDAGLVMRGGDDADRRRKVVEITELALERMRPVTAPYIAGLQDLAANREPHEWQTIARFLADFRALNEQHAQRLAVLGDDEIQGIAVAGA